MANVLCFYRDRYFMWSTVVDAPSSLGMTERECVNSLVWNWNGHTGHSWGIVAENMALARKSGTNSSIVTLEDINKFNRAGYGESWLSLDEIYQIYCVEQREPQPGEGSRRYADEY